LLQDAYDIQMKAMSQEVEENEATHASAYQSEVRKHPDFQMNANQCTNFEFHHKTPACPCRMDDKHLYRSKNSTTMHTYFSMLHGYDA
jgi:hypothetical protein